MLSVTVVRICHAPWAPRGPHGRTVISGDGWDRGPTRERALVSPQVLSFIHYFYRAVALSFLPYVFVYVLQLTVGKLLFGALRCGMALTAATLKRERVRQHDGICLCGLLEIK